MNRSSLLLMAMCVGCVLDFDQFGVLPARDVGVDLAHDASEDRMDDVSIDMPLDVPIDRGPPPLDRAAPLDRPLACIPGRGVTARVRFAHMAEGIGPVNLCVRRRITGAERFIPMPGATWPSTGVDYTQVTGSSLLPLPVNSLNEPWEIAVVPQGTSCSGDLERDAHTIRALQFDPGVLRLLVLTSERTLSDLSVPVLDGLVDSTCTDCTPGRVDVRAVHASLGASSSRISFRLEPQKPIGTPDGDLQMMRTFASRVSHGSDEGYVCNRLWGNVAALQLPGSSFTISFVASTAVGDFARTEQIRLNGALLLRTRTATVFFVGDLDLETLYGTAQFVVCYDGNEFNNVTTCDRFPAYPLVSSDAGVTDASDASALPVDATRDDGDVQ